MDKPDHLQIISVPSTITDDCYWRSSISPQDTVLSDVSDCVLGGRVVNQPAVASRLSASENDVSTVARSLPVGAKPNVSAVSSVSSASVSCLGDSVKCRGVTTAPCFQSSSISRNFSTANSSKSSSSRCSMASVDFCLSSPPCTACSSRTGTEPAVSPALLALVSQAAALKKQLPTASGCSSVLSAVGDSSTTLASLAPVKTSSGVVSSTVHSSASTTVVSPSSSCPSISVTECSDIITSSEYQSSMVPPSQLPDKRLTSQSVSSTSSNIVSIHQFAPLYVVVQPPPLSFPNAAVHSSAVTSFCQPVRACCLSATRMSDKVCSRTRSVSGISSRVCTCTVPGASLISVGVPTAGISNRVPTVGLSSSVCTGTPATAGITSPLCVHAIPPAGFSDRVQMYTVPAVGISNPVRVCSVSSAGISGSLCACNVLSRLMKSNVKDSGRTVWHGDTLSTSSMSQDVPSSTAVSATQRVLPPATGWRTRQTYVLSSASKPSSFSICSPGLSSFQTTVRPASRVASVPSRTHPESVSIISAISRSDRHFLDSIVSPKPRPFFTTKTQHSQLPSLSLCSPAVTSYMVTTGSRNPATANSSVDTSSVPLSARSITSSLTRVLSPSALNASVTSSVVSFTAQATSSRVVTRPTFSLFSTERRPLLDKIALQLSSQSLSKSTAQKLTVPNSVDNSASDFLHSRVASADDGATESVVTLASSSMNHPRHRHIDREGCHVAKRDMSLQAAGACVSVAVAASADDYCHVNDGGIDYSNSKQADLTASVDSNQTVESDVRDMHSLSADPALPKTSKTVAAVTASVGSYRHHGGRELSGCMASRAVDETVKSVAIVTSPLESYVHHSSGELSCRMASSGVDETARSVVMVTASSVDNCRYSNSTAVNSVAMTSSVMATAAADHRHSSREVSGRGRTMKIARMQRKANKVRPCTQVTTDILNIAFLLC